MRHLYFYVPPCPKCGSYKTGRFENLLFSPEDDVRENGLKHGEYIRARRNGRIENVYCEDCGHAWIDSVQRQRLEQIDIDKQKKLRGTEEAYLQMTGLRGGTQQKKKKGFLQNLIGF